jgi:flavin reductase (DIM6/NTAB) family NADH-FMN oxidoreductase RutF
MTSEEDLPPRGVSIQGARSIGPGARAKADRWLEGLEVIAADGVDRDSLWASMRRFAAGVTVVTAVSEEGYLGITVSAFCLVSLEPALILVCIHEDSQVLDAVAASSAFAVTALSSRQELLAEMFAGRAPRPDTAFSGIPHRTLLTGAPILEGGLAWLDCRLTQATPAGDHTVCIGAVVAAGVAEGYGDPLLYFGSQYRRLSP